MSKKPKDQVVATLSGAIAGGIETCVVWPMEYTKTQLQLNKRGKYSGMMDVARHTYNNNGILGFYRGLLPVLIGSIPKAAIRFGGFNLVQGKLAKEDGSSTPMRNLFAGTVAGALESLVVATPVETVKTKLIDGNAGFVQGALRILKTEGIGGMYQGALATTAKQASNQGLRFMAFGIYTKGISDYVHNDPKWKLLWYESLIGGMMAGCFSTLCNNPFDMIKTRMQGLRASEYNGFLDCLRKVVQEEGVLALWSGTVPRLTRVVPGQGVIFMSYTKISEVVAKALGREG